MTFQSFGDIKAELKQFFKKDAFSKLFQTNKLNTKLFSITSIIVLSMFCIYFIIQNISNYSKWDVITDVKIKDVDSLTFPAVTFCMMYDLSFGKLISYQLNDEILAYCSFDERKCQVEDFVEIPVWYASISGVRQQIKCYKFNSGKDSHGNPRELVKTTSLVENKEFRILMNLSSGSIVRYLISDNQYLLTENDIRHFLLPGSFVGIKFKKIVDEKLPQPYNPCIDRDSINKFDSKLVREFTRIHDVYRRVNCFDLCYQDHLESVAILMNVTLLEAFRNISKFNQHYQCDHLCPLECDSISFEISVNQIPLIDSEYNFFWKRYLNNSNGYEKEKLLVLRLEYDEMKYTQMSQTAKMTLTDLVSNIGGVLGVFLEMSFYTAYRICYFLLDSLIK